MRHELSSPAGAVDLLVADDRFPVHRSRRGVFLHEDTGCGFGLTDLGAFTRKRMNHSITNQTRAGWKALGTHGVDRAAEGLAGGSLAQVDC